MTGRRRRGDGAHDTPPAGERIAARRVAGPVANPGVRFRWLQEHWPGAGGSAPRRPPPAGAPLGTPPKADGDPPFSWSTLVWSGFVHGLVRVRNGLLAMFRIPGTWLRAYWPGQHLEEGRTSQDRVLTPEPAAAIPREPDRAGGPPGPVRAEPRPVAARRSFRVRRPSKTPLFGLRQLRTVFKAVYTALADPIVGADEEARERRALRVRRVGRIAVSTGLATVLIYAIFPVREYLDQRAALARQQDRQDVLNEENELLEQRRDQLLDNPDEIERLAREHGWIYPDEESITLLPGPEG